MRDSHELSLGWRNEVPDGTLSGTAKFMCFFLPLTSQVLDIRCSFFTTTLRSEIITQLILQKIFRAMITRISCNPARNNSSEIFWRNDKMAIAQIYFWKHATRTIRKQRVTTKLRNPPENNSPRVISRNQLRQFRAIPRKIIPQQFFRAQCFLNGGYWCGCA